MRVRGRNGADHLVTQPQRYERERPAAEAAQHLRPRARPATEAGVAVEVVDDERPAR